MTPIEKAKELVEKFKPLCAVDIYGNYPPTRKTYAKECSIIAVDEILDFFSKMPQDISLHFIKYYQEVKEEIIKL